jgi:prevent-host-death family protein
VNKAKIADLKNNLSRYLSLVRKGGEIIVLDREKPIARIVPFAPRRAAGGRRPRGRAGDEYWTADRLADLERRGRISHAGDAEATRAWLAAYRPAKLPPGGPSLSDLFLQMREEEPW